MYRLYKLVSIVVLTILIIVLLKSFTAIVAQNIFRISLNDYNDKDWIAMDGFLQAEIIV